MIEIHFSYVESVKIFLSQKSKYDLSVNMKNRIKDRTRASLFQSSEDGKQEFFLMWPKKNELSMKNGVQIAKKIHNNVRY